MSRLKILPEQAILLLEGRIGEMQVLMRTSGTPGYYDVVGWCSKTWSAVDQIYPADDIHPEEIRSMGLPTCSCNSRDTTQMLFEIYHSRLLAYISEIEKMAKTPG